MIKRTADIYVDIETSHLSRCLQDISSAISSGLVWFMLLMLVLFASMMWVSEATQNVSEGIMNEVYQHYNIHTEAAYLAEQSHRIHNTNAMFTVASFAVFIIFAMISVDNFQITRKREKEHLERLSIAEQKATTDQLTGIKNRHAYHLREEEINEQIAAGKIESFAIAVCDINNLKLTNDQKGHNLGDQCICKCCKLICDIFKNSTVYRIGGDEFAVILGDDDYENWNMLEEVSNQTVSVDEAITSKIAVGISEYQKGKDSLFLEVFTRADRKMYERKTALKAMGK